ncbi:MAG: hypothetical protein JSS81_16120 [Acidobacteria bacterium]|nr:hypothetical protein [Acidobacteriota bacterium]
MFLTKLKSEVFKGISGADFMKSAFKPAGTAFSIALLVVFTIVFAISSSAQTAAVYGQLGNFDVINHTGHDGHGFEIELEGIQPQEVVYHFSYQRYGAARITPTATGTLVRWESSYSGGAFTATTIPHAPNTPFAGSCYMGGASYDTSGCEHFGVSLSATPTRAQYRWLIEDAANPGTLIPFNPPAPVVTPVYVVTPPVREGEAPVLEAEIEAPEPAEAPELYGDAQWVKVFKTQLNREVGLDELITTNPIVPQDAAHTEVEWEIVQTEPASNSNGNRRQRRSNSATLNFDTRAIVRRYEVYAYTGAYDPVTHEALCADLLCNAPGDGELGEFQSAQMTAANVQVNSVTVAKTGSGSVSSADRLISCGNKCAAGYNAGAAVTLTASPSSGYLFTGWNGACAGNLLTCVVNATDALNVTANFAQAFSISAKTAGGKGTVTSNSGINCGKTCSSTVVRGTNVTLRVTPDPGFRFVNWSGACSGTATTCSVTVNATSSVQANFAK